MSEQAKQYIIERYTETDATWGKMAESTFSLQDKPIPLVNGKYSFDKIKENGKNDLPNPVVVNLCLFDLYKHFDDDKRKVYDCIEGKGKITMFLIYGSNEKIEFEVTENMSYKAFENMIKDLYVANENIIAEALKNKLIKIRQKKQVVNNKNTDKKTSLEEKNGKIKDLIAIKNMMIHSIAKWCNPGL